MLTTRGLMNSLWFGQVFDIDNVLQDRNRKPENQITEQITGHIQQDVIHIEIPIILTNQLCQRPLQHFNAQ